MNSRGNPRLVTLKGGTCPHCDYDLTGTHVHDLTATCPECGGDAFTFPRHRSGWWRLVTIGSWMSTIVLAAGIAFAGMLVAIQAGGSRSLARGVWIATFLIAILVIRVLTYLKRRWLAKAEATPRA